MKITKEIRHKTLLMLFGLTLFPAVAFGFGHTLFGWPGTVSGFYRYFYGGLLDMGKDGMITWGIACAPYMIYEIFSCVGSIRFGLTKSKWESSCHEGSD